MSDADASGDAPVLVSDEGGVRTLILNRPKARNAMSRAMIAALQEGFDDAGGSDAVRVLVVRGAGGHFCAGGDIKDMAAARMGSSDNDGVDPVHALSVEFGRIARAFARTPLPTVAVLEGAVMGGGFGLACTADVVIASSSAELRLPETSLGLIPAQIAPFLIERLGYSEAKRLALLGETLDARAALALRLVHEVVEPDELEAALKRTLDKLLRCAPKATQATKRLFHHLYPGAGEAVIQHAAAVFTEAARGPEAAEGVGAFMAKRPPSWAE